MVTKELSIIIIEDVRTRVCVGVCVCVCGCACMCVCQDAFAHFWRYRDETFAGSCEGFMQWS